MAYINSSRRSFVKAIGGGIASSFLYRANSQGLTPIDLPIQHVVVLTMENRSFDHFLGWLPNSNGKQAGLSYPDRNGTMQPTYHLADYQGCNHPVPDNTYQGARVEYDNGKCDGWLLAGENDNFTIGYYQQSDLAFLGQAAPQWITCDNYFAPTLSSTYPNRMYMHAAQTDRQDNSLTISTLPTIWDNLAAHHRTGRYYFSDIPFLALWGAKYLPIAHFISDFFADCAAGSLADVSYIDPHMLGESQGLSNDDHPHSDIRNGEAFMNAIYNAVVTSPAWKKTVLVITFDEWGGFFDHVAPQTAPDVNPANALRGFRIPALIISPWSFSPRTVAHTLFDHTSILKMIETQFGLPALTRRDASANSLASVLQFGKPAKQGPVYAVPPGPFGSPCPAVASPVNTSTGESEWMGLAALAARYGWPIGL